MTNNLPAISCSTLTQYINSVFKIPNLTLEEEINLAKQYQEHETVSAAHRLVESHLKYVVKIAKNFAGYGLPQEDLIQEGNIGLMKAVKKFDYTYGFRFVSFAYHHIRYEIMEFVLRNFRIVRLGTVKSDKKLFFNFRNLRSGKTQNVSSEEAAQISAELNVSVDEVYRAEQIFANDVSTIVDVDGEEAYHILDSVADNRYEPLRLLEFKEEEGRTARIVEAIESMDERERFIINNRYLVDEKITLKDIGAKFGISNERVRQIEVKAIEKIKSMVM